MEETPSATQVVDFVNKKKESTFSLTFFVGMAIYLTVIVIIGFWPTYFGSVLLGQEPVSFGLVEISWEIHLHAFVFMVWMGILLAQTFWVASDRRQTHMNFGKYGFLLGAIMVVIGLFMTYVQVESAVAKEIITWSEAIPGVFTTNSFFSINQFLMLLVLGYYYRSKPAAHKRFMLIATIVIVNAATSRWGIMIGEWSNEIINLLMIGPIWVYDFYSDKRIHKATLIGTAIMSLYFLKRYLLS